MEKRYVEKRDEGYWVGDSRVSVDSVVLAFLNGLSPESIAAECFPTLSLEQGYGVITYYLAHRAEIDVYLKEAGAEFDELRERTQSADPQFSRKLAEARRQMSAARS